MGALPDGNGAGARPVQYWWAPAGLPKPRGGRMVRRCGGAGRPSGAPKLADDAARTVGLSGLADARRRRAGLGRGAGGRERVPDRLAVLADRLNEWAGRGDGQSNT